MSGYTELVMMFTSADYKSRYAQAKASGTCIRCGEKAVEFNYAHTRLEYSVSALCEECQGRFFDSTGDRQIFHHVEL
jgi:hypothetical protein